MALTQVYTAVPNDVITAARWNNEFGNIYNNGTQIPFPLTAAVSFNGKIITWDVAGATTMTSAAEHALSFTPGAKAGTPNTTGKVLNVVANTFTDSVTAGSGTATSFASVAIQQPTLAATNTVVTTTDAATLYIAAAPANGTNETITNPWAIWVDAGNVRLDADLSVTGNLRATAALGGYIQGLTYSRDAGDVTNDIAVAIGIATSDDATQVARQTMTLTTSIVKQVDVNWVVGTGQGGLDTGAVGNVPYYVWLIMRPDTGVVDVLFSASGSSPTMPTGYTFKRLIGWFTRLAGVNNPFTTYELTGGGIELLWTTPLNDVAIANTLTTARRLDTLSVPVTFSTEVRLRLIADDASPFSVLVQNPDETDAAPSTTTTPGVSLKSSVAGVPATSEAITRTSATGQVASRAGLTIDAYDIITVGFLWSRR